MKLENQVCTLEQAKKLDKLLGKHAPASFWVWVEPPNQKAILKTQTYVDSLKSAFIINPPKFYPAYTGDESGVLLPGYLILETKESYLNIWKSGKYSMCAYRNTENDFPVSEHFRARSEAHAKPALLIHLLEQKIINPKDLKL